MKEKLKNFSVLKLLLVLVLIFSMIASTSSSAMAASKPLLIGHRGYSGKYFENTLSSLQAAYNSGFNGVEIDLWESTDGSLWVFHDETLNRLTGKDGKIYHLTKKIRGKYLLTNGTKIPTLEDVLKKVKGKKNFYIHIKGNGKKNVLSKSGQKKIIKLLKKYKMTKNTVIFSGEKNMKKLNFGSIKTGWITGKTNLSSIKATLKRAKKHGVKYYIVYKTDAFKSKANQKGIISYAKKCGIKVGCYKLDTSESQSISDYKKLAKYGVSLVFSDYYIR